MEIKFYTNAALEIAIDSSRILCDPWLVPGAFDDSWWQYPPLVTKPEDVKDYTHLYISHIHSDHCDLRTLKRLKNKDVPVFILKINEKFLRKSIESCGYSNIVELEDGEQYEISPQTYVTMYGAFAPNVFIENSSIPNVIDSSIVVSNGGQVVFNANDNVPNKSACQRIMDAHSHIDVALLPYCGVGPFPSSYDHLDMDRKKIESDKKKQKYLERLLDNVTVLKPGLTIPAAGQMILAGKQFHKNEVLGVAASQDAVELLKSKGYKSMLLEEGDILNIDSGELKKTIKHSPPTQEQINAIKSATYWWEQSFRIPDDEFAALFPLLKNAYKKMCFIKGKYQFQADWYVGITVEEQDDTTYVFSLNSHEEAISMKTTDLFASDRKFLQAKVPYNYLIALLTKRCHWNNAYHGCLIEWYRKPDEYMPEIQTLLSYFHL